MDNLSLVFNELRSHSPLQSTSAEHPANNAAETSTDLLQALKKMDLLANGDRAQVSPMPGAMSSELRKVELGWGKVCLKKSRPLLAGSDSDVPMERSRYEYQWLKLARSALGEAVPEVYGEHEAMFAMEYLDPQTHGSWREQLCSGDISPSTAAAVGRLIGRFHAATANNLAIAQCFPSDAAFIVLRIQQLFVAGAASQSGVAKRLLELAAMLRECRIALIHGNLCPENVLVGSRGPILIDAQCASYGDPAFDLASCLAELLLLGVWAPLWRDPYLNCYAAFQAAYLQRINWEGPEQTEERAALLLPAILLGAARGGLPSRHLYETEKRDLVASIARKLLTEPVFRLSAVRETWRRALPV